jgi:K+-sensing histidine kinase KdpD
LAVLAGVLAPLGIAALLVPFRSNLADSAAALILVAVVVAVAANGSRTAGFVGAVSATLWFDFFLTRPYERLAITHRPDIETAVSLLAVGLAVTEIAARSRAHHRVANEEADYVGLIYYLSELVAEGTPAEQVVERANAELIELLHLRSSRFDPDPGDRPGTEMEHSGDVHLGLVQWGADLSGLPGKEVVLLVQGRGHLLGRFVFEPTPGWPVSLQRRFVAVAIADQVGAALTPHVHSA